MSIPASACFPVSPSSLPPKGPRIHFFLPPHVFSHRSNNLFVVFLLPDFPLAPEGFSFPFFPASHSPPGLSMVVLFLLARLPLFSRGLLRPLFSFFPHLPVGQWVRKGRSIRYFAAFLFFLIPSGPCLPPHTRVNFSPCPHKSSLVICAWSLPSPSLLAPEGLAFFFPSHFLHPLGSKGPPPFFLSPPQHVPWAPRSPLSSFPRKRKHAVVTMSL